MAPAKDKWVRRFIIPETTRHKKGFTIYKVTSMVFLKSSHEEISKVSVWKRYNDFKKLHSELLALSSRSQIKESFPKFPKSKFFGRFEAEVIKERRECALKLLDFIGRHSCLYTSDIFIKFFETSHMDNSHDCSQSLSSDTSEDDRHTLTNSAPIDLPIDSHSISVTIDHVDGIVLQKPSESINTSLKKTSVNDCSIERAEVSEVKTTFGNAPVRTNNCEEATIKLNDDQSISSQNNNPGCNVRNNETNGKHPVSIQAEDNVKHNGIVKESRPLINVHDGSDLPQSWPDSSQYILIAAAHMSAAFRHEAMAEYEEAFTQYKMGISSLFNGVESDSDTVRAEIIKEKISKYLERAEKLYNRYLNCNISLLKKPVSELEHYKVLKIMRSVMLVRDLRQNCLRIVKAVEKSSANKESISNYILRGQVPYMVRLHACVETETTVFLILDYLSRGKLWDFITVQYKCDEDAIPRTDRPQESYETAVENSIVILRENGIKQGVEYVGIPMIKADFASTSPRVQTEDYPPTVEKEDEIYTSDVSTTQLLEKAQILLQSVNATLKESNTVASRLRESKQLLTQDSTALLNIKNTTCQPSQWNIILTDVNGTPNESHSINETELQQRGASLKSSSSSDDTKNDKSPDATDSSSLTDSYTDLSISEKDSTGYSLDNSKSISVHFAAECASTMKTDDTYDLSRALQTSCKIEGNSYIIADEQMQYFDTGSLTEYTRNNNSDLEEEVLWVIPGSVVRLWAAEIVLALEALHQQEVIVFDLKPDNLLLDDTGHVHLTYIIPHHNTDLTKHKQPYASPELCMFLPTIPVTTATDVWSFGVILYELIIGNKFQTRHPGLFHSHSIINIPSTLCENTKSLLLNTLKYEPSERMTIAEIKQHPFFEEIDWANLVNSQM